MPGRPTRQRGCPLSTNCNEGERLKRAALNLLTELRADIIAEARRAMLRVLLDKGEATADDVRAVVTIPDEMNPKLFGAVPSELAAEGFIEAAGFVRSKRPKAHARPLTRWRLIDRPGAEAWLAKTDPESNRKNFNKGPGAGTPGKGVTER